MSIPDVCRSFGKDALLPVLRLHLQLRDASDMVPVGVILRRASASAGVFFQHSAMDARCPSMGVSLPGGFV